MSDATPSATEPASVAIPDPAAADRAVDAARGQFRRILCSWASDLLELRRSGHARTSWTGGAEPDVAPMPDAPTAAVRDDIDDDDVDPGLDLAA